MSPLRAAARGEPARQGGKRISRDTSENQRVSDGVLSVAITLLALNLIVAGPGHGSLASLLLRE